MSDFSTGCMGLWSPESDMRVAAQHARHENEMLQLEMETQAKIQEIQANTHANEMSRMMDKYNEVVDKYNKLAGRAWIFQAERDTAYEILRENQDVLPLTEEEINARLESRRAAVRQAHNIA